MQDQHGLWLHSRQALQKRAAFTVHCGFPAKNKPTKRSPANQENCRILWKQNDGCFIKSRSEPTNSVHQNNSSNQSTPIRNHCGFPAKNKFAWCDFTNFSRFQNKSQQIHLTFRFQSLIYVQNLSNCCFHAENQFAWCDFTIFLEIAKARVSPIHFISVSGNWFIFKFCQTVAGISNYDPSISWIFFI